MKARYVHTNLIANDWQVLSQFYEKVLGCIPVPPERDYTGSDLEAGTGIASASLKGVHLRLPGGGDNGPTLEVFQFGANLASVPTAVNRPGFGHIAFAVEDVESARNEVLAAGGREVGKVVTLQTAAGTHVTWCYVTDPEGNVIEFQSWS